jgi:quercetin dioxygenase-like cupin family protein
LYLLSGEIEQWLEQEKRTLRKGDVAFVAPGVVHASFNCGQETATFLVVLSPSVGEEGYESEEVAAQAPWNGIRNPV